MIVGEKTFTVDLLVLMSAFRIEQGHKAPALKLRWPLHSQELQYGGGNIEQAGRLVDSGGAGTRAKRPVQDQRDSECALINKITMGALTMVTQSFAMVRGKDDK